MLSMADDMSPFKPLLHTSTAALGNSRVAQRRREDSAHQSPYAKLSRHTLLSRSFPGTVLVWT
jgi:hypothetical protein